MFKMNVDAAKYFNRCLFSDHPDAKAALSYFTDKRGLSPATIKHFGLGFAPNSFDAFSKYMLAKGYSFEELEAGFLCGKSDKGRYYDAFRNRIMIPIIDVSGNVFEEAPHGLVYCNAHNGQGQSLPDGYRIHDNVCKKIGLGKEKTR